MRECLHTSTFMTDTTILDHSGILFSILKAPLRNHRFALKPHPAIYVSAFCPMLGLGKLANLTIGVAKSENFELWVHARAYT